jgi:hypothetical protein
MSPLYSVKIVHYIIIYIKNSVEGEIEGSSYNAFQVLLGFLSPMQDNSVNK